MVINYRGQYFVPLEKIGQDGIGEVHYLIYYICWMKNSTWYRLVWVQKAQGFKPGVPVLCVCCEYLRASTPWVLKNCWNILDWKNQILISYKKVLKLFWTVLSEPNLYPGIITTCGEFVLQISLSSAKNWNTQGMLWRKLCIPVSFFITFDKSLTKCFGINVYTWNLMLQCSKSVR